LLLPHQQQPASPPTPWKSFTWMQLKGFTTWTNLLKRPVAPALHWNLSATQSSAIGIPAAASNKATASPHFIFRLSKEPADPFPFCLHLARSETTKALSQPHPPDSIMKLLPGNFSNTLKPPNQEPGTSVRKPSNLSSPIKVLPPASTHSQARTPNNRTLPQPSLHASFDLLKPHRTCPSQGLDRPPSTQSPQQPRACPRTAGRIPQPGLHLLRWP